MMRIDISTVAFALLAGSTLVVAAEPIDRYALVTRHNPTLTAVDKSAPLMVGNGSIGFTADITGLQTFPEQYSPLVPLMTQAQWAWHSFPGNYTLDSAQVPVDVRGKPQKYPSLESWEEAKKPNIRWLRENPHRFSLGRLSLRLVRKDGSRANFTDVSAARQSLDLWTGRISSRFVFEGTQVEVETSVHPTRDIIIVRLNSALLFDGRLGVELGFPGVSATLNPDPADWEHPEKHVTAEVTRDAGGLTLSRQLDETRYSVKVAADRELGITSGAPHGYALAAPGSTQLTLLVEFSPQPGGALPSPDTARADVAKWWEDYWSKGGVVDFSGSTDPRAGELERRVVLSQYLMALNAAGTLPPQEEGLFSNSWNGKFHLEMHAWHSAHFAVWGRPELLERSMPWYFAHLKEAQARARTHKAKGAWWPKMVGPEGRESPSTVNPFIMWQQPHPIYLAELIYNAHPDRATLEKYAPLVFASAELLASWPHKEKGGWRYNIGPPIIPAQETHPPLTTMNPTFELEYFRFGLETANKWRKRLGKKPVKKWERVALYLSEPARRDGLYLAAESQQDLWVRSIQPECTSPKTGPNCPNRDHPSFVAAFGLLPGTPNISEEHMRCTLDAVIEYWDLRQTWGWDWPMMAMTAARLGDGELAVNFLLPKLAKNFQFGTTGMTPRVQLAVDDAAPAAGSPDGPGYRRVAETYFPSNGSLLLAVGMMAATNRFPDDGWVVRSEGLIAPP
jgi:hypothetical protein